MVDYFNSHKSSATFVGHNAIDYDCKWLTVLIPHLDGLFHRDNVLDTVVLSRLQWVGRPDGHSLEAWGTRFKLPKIEHDDFSQYSDEMLSYCVRDVLLTERLYLYLIDQLSHDTWQDAIRIEHRTQWLARSMTEHGFYFDIDEAELMLEEVTIRSRELYNAMVDDFPPKIKLTQLKTKLKREEVPFNPGSPKQVVERLNEFGWQPVEKTKGHIDAERSTNTDPERLAKFRLTGWKVNEVNLSTLPDDAPETCKLLIEWLLVDARKRTLTEWITNYNKHTHRVHGNFNPLGTRTQRWVHSKPNLGNVATAKTIKYNNIHLRNLAIDYGRRMRSLWTVPAGSSFVGVDMESAHLRIFGHLINDKDFIEALVSGRKEDGTDPHTMNKHKIGDICVDRDRAKTFIFTFLNGGGSNKISQIFNCSKKEGKTALDNYIDSYPGLKTLKKDVIPQDADRGYCLGLDGRKIACDSAHHMMGVYLQSAESIIMKYAIDLMCDKLSQGLDKLGISYYIVNVVHDEVLIEVNTTDKEILEWVGTTCSQCITTIGEHFKYNCPLAGEYKVGSNWYEVH